MNAHLDRLKAMTDPKQQTWELSPNDVKAIEWTIAEIERLQEERDAWRSACTTLHTVFRKLGPRGRPMDLVGIREWSDVVRMIAEAEGKGGE